MPWKYTYDEKKDELFMTTLASQFLVYNRSGEFSRKLPMPEGMFYGVLSEFDDSQLITYTSNKNSSSYLLIDKIDGEIRNDFTFTYEKELRLVDFRPTEDGIIGVMNESFRILKHSSGIFLNEYSQDTVFLFTPEKTLIPKVIRTPPSQKMEPLIYLNSLLETKDYYFFSHVKVKYDWDTDSGKGLPLTHIGMDKKSGKFFTQNITFKDYKNKQFSLSPGVIEKTNNPELGMITLSTEQLIAAYEKNELSGELKEIASTLEVDDNYVIMFLKFK